jgi:GatB domain
LTWSVEWDERARRELRRLDPAVQRRILAICASGSPALTIRASSAGHSVAAGMASGATASGPIGSSAGSSKSDSWFWFSPSATARRCTNEGCDQRDSARGGFVGQVMKATQGQTNPQLVNKVLKKKLGV